MENRDAVVNSRNVPDLNSAIDELLADGFRIDMIMPADDPQVAVLSKSSEKIKLSAARNPNSEIRNPKSNGRAGMQYRDLIPDRLGGFLIASHIRIAQAGDVPDYVHYHRLLFQMIYCKSGWIRLVYEDQGPPFVMNAGDCVLQPPEIRHRVLEASAGAEVIEVSAPAIHETWVDHDLQLPTEVRNSEKLFNRQKFVRHIAADAVWQKDGFGEYRDTGILGATGGLASVVVRRVPANTSMTFPNSEITFVFVLDGAVSTTGVGQPRLGMDDSLVISPDSKKELGLTALADAEVLEVMLSPELAHRFLAVSVPTDREP